MQIIELDDLSRPELAPFARLTEAQLRNRRDPEQGLFIAESPKVIEKALDAGCQPVSFLMERRHIDGQGSGLLARCGGVPVYTGDRELLAELTGFALTRGILCAMRRPALPEVSALCASARRLGDGRRPSDAQLLRSPVPQSRSGQHGCGLSDPLVPPGAGTCRLAQSAPGARLQDGCSGPPGRRPPYRCSSPGPGIPSGPRPGDGGGWAVRTGHPGLRLHGAHPHVPRGELPECGDGQRGGLLAVGPPVNLRRANRIPLPGADGSGEGDLCFDSVVRPGVIIGPDLLRPGQSHHLALHCPGLRGCPASDAGPGLQQQGRRDGEFLQAPGQQ